MRIIGLTGGIACGKSLLTTSLVKDADIAVIDADAISRQVCAKGQPCVLKLVERFGPDILVDPSCTDRKAMELDRKSLGEIVFKDKGKLKLLTGKLLG